MWLLSLLDLLTWLNSCLSVRNIGHPPEFAIPPYRGPFARAVPTSGQLPSIWLQSSAARWSSAVLVCTSLGVSTIAFFMWRCLQVSSACAQANATCVSWSVAQLAPGMCFSTALHFSACHTTALQGSGRGSGSQRLVFWPSMTSALSKFHSCIDGRFSHWSCRYEASCWGTALLIARWVEGYWRLLQLFLSECGCPDQFRLLWTQCYPGRQSWTSSMVSCRMVNVPTHPATSPAIFKSAFQSGKKINPQLNSITCGWQIQIFSNLMT